MLSSSFHAFLISTSLSGSSTVISLLSSLNVMRLLKQDTICDEEKNEYLSYGVEAVGSEGEILSSYSDLFFDRQKAERFVNLCNESGLSLVHLSYAVEDAITG